MINYQAIYYIEKIFISCDRIYFNTNEYISTNYNKNNTCSNRNCYLDFVSFYQHERAVLKSLEKMIEDNFDEKEIVKYVENIRKSMKEDIEECKKKYKEEQNKNVLNVYKFIDDNLNELIKTI